MAVGVAIEANPAFTERSVFEAVSMTRMDSPTVKWQRTTVLARNRLVADPIAFQAMPDPVWFILCDVSYPIRPSPDLVRV